MPIYEYRCQKCGHEMEALRKISDPPLTECPKCHAASLQKLVSAASFRLKGGGWYETDFKSGDKKHLADSDGNKEKSTSKETAAGDVGKSSKDKDKTATASEKSSKGSDADKSKSKDKAAAKSSTSASASK